MKWNMVFGALVVSVGLCSQSFGFELLDRMLGLNDSGCNTCCTAEPACGCDKGFEPSCYAAADPGCCAVVDPGCCAAPSCCDPCHTKRCWRPKFNGALLAHVRGIFACHTCCDSGCAAEPACCAAVDPGCCAAVDPGCCAEPACAAPVCDPCNTCNTCKPCCKKRHGGLLSALFHHKKCCKPACHTGCATGCATECATGCASGCGSAPISHDVDGGSLEEAAPMPPAPTADPSASVPSKRRVIAASNKVVRN